MNQNANTIFTGLCYAADTLAARIGHSGGCGSYTASFDTAPPAQAGDVEPNGNNDVLASIDQIQETYEEGEEWTRHLGSIDVDTGQDIQDWFYIVSPEDGDVVLTVNPTGTLPGFIYPYEKGGTQIGSLQMNQNTNTIFIGLCYAADTLVARIGRSGGCGSYTASFTTSDLS